MEYQELIMARRSVRAYNGTPVSREIVEEIIRDSQTAPSWKNLQPTRFYAAVTPEGLEKVRACLPEFNRNSSAGCGAYVVTTFVRGLSGFNKATGEPDNELGDLWGAYDLGANNAYLVLAAANRGVDSLIMGIRDGEALRTALGIPENETVCAVIALGVRKDQPKFFPRKDLAEVAKIF